MTALANSEGDIVVEYTYDAWGNILSTTGTLASTLGKYNPLRYRGYVYDIETQLYYLQSRYYDPAMGRFINADVYTSTGQGLLGNNMFAYCLNNPVNRIDASGTVSLWYYLIIDSDFGFIHRTVQLHILAIYGTSFTKELTLGGHGRADIVDTSCGAVWEVKHASKDPSGRAVIATAQAATYIGGTHGDITITSLGSAGTFTGFFHIQCGDYSYRVDYWTPQDGAVLYSVQEVSDYSGEYYAVYVPREVREREKSGVPAYLLLAGIPFCGGGGRDLEVTFYESAYVS